MRLTCLLLALAAPARAAFPGATVWTFQDPAEPLRADSGPAILDYYDPAGTGWGPKRTGFGASGPFRRAMRLGARSAFQGYSLRPNAAPNGVFKGLGLVSNYTLVFDVMWPAASTRRWRAVYQTSIDNSDDAELYFRYAPAGGVGINNAYHGTIEPGRWHRVAVAVQASAGTGGTGHIQKFIDGRFVGGHITPGEGPGSRWALGPEALLFTDGKGAAVDGWVAGMMFVPRRLTMAEIEALGGPSPQGPDHPGQTAPAMPKASRRVGVVAHRGKSCCAPENTVPAILAAIESGADAMEIDIRLTRDGVAILMHDPTLERTTDGAGKVTETKYRDIRKLDAGSWFDPAFAGTPVPTLEEAFEAAKGKLVLYLDVKDARLGRAIAKAAKRSGFDPKDLRVWQNDNAAGVRELREDLEGVPFQWGSAPSEPDEAFWKRMRDLRIVGFEVEHGALSKKFLREARERGLPVTAFTVNDPATMRELIDMGVDAIETDYPHELKRILP